MRRRQIQTVGFDDVDSYSDDSEPETLQSSRRGVGDGVTGESLLRTPSEAALDRHYADYGHDGGDASPPPPRATPTAAPPSEVNSIATAQTATTRTQSRRPRSMSTAGQHFPGVMSISTQQQKQPGADHTSCRSSCTTKVQSGGAETATEAAARRHRRRFLQLCGLLPEKRTTKSTTDASATPHGATNLLASEGASMDATLGMRYGNGTRGVKERREEEERQRDRARKAERDHVITRSRRVSVFDRLVRRPSMHVARGSRDEPQLLKDALQAFSLPQVHVPHGKDREESVAGPSTRSPRSGAYYDNNGVGTGGAVSLPNICGTQRTGDGLPHSETPRGRSVPLATADLCGGDDNVPIGRHGYGAAGGERTLRPVQRAMRYEGGGVIDTFGYFPNHRTNPEYYKKMHRAREVRQTRPLEVNRETGALITASDRSKGLVAVPPMAELYVERPAPGRTRKGHRASSHKKSTRASAVGPRSRSSSRTGVDVSPVTNTRPPPTASSGSPSPQRPYRFYSVAEDGVIYGFDLEAHPSEGTSGSGTSRRQWSERDALTLTSSAGRTDERDDVAAVTKAARTTEPAWLVDVGGTQASGATAFAVRASEAKPYEDQYGQVVQTLVYPVELTVSTSTPGRIPERRVRGVSMLSAVGRDRWGEPLASPPQTTTVVVRQYTNDNGSKPVRLHLPPGTSVEDLHGRGEFPSISLPWL